MKRDEEDDQTTQTPEPEAGGWVYHVPNLLRKYGSHALLALSLVLLGFVLWQKYRAGQVAKEDESRLKLFEAQTKILQAEQGLTDENPANALRSVASSTDLPAVRAQAYLALGQYYLNAINRGHYGLAEKVDVDDALRQAEAAYKKVLGDSKEISPFTLSAQMGLGRIAEDQHDWKAAAEAYQKVIADATQFGDPGQARVAQNKLKALPRLSEPIALAPTAPAASMPAMPSFMNGGGDLIGPPR